MAQSKAARNASLLLLLGITLIVFTRVTGFEFVSIGDPAYVTDNYHLGGGLNRSGVSWAFHDTSTGIWQPITWLSFLLDAQVHGMSPFGYHLTNLILHLINVLLLFLLLLRLTGYPWRSAFAAALFAVHPLHVEPVAWVAARKDLLGAFFFLLTVRAYVRCVRESSGGQYLAILFFFALGLMSNPVLVVLPLALLTVDYWPLGRWNIAGEQKGKVSNRSLVTEKTPLFVFAIASAIITYRVQHQAVARGVSEAYSITTRLVSGLAAYADYLIKMVWPRGLSVIYAPVPSDFSTAKILGFLALLVAATLIILRLSRGRRYLGMGWLWYLITILPPVWLSHEGGHIMGDRYTYIPLIGIFVIVAWAGADLAERIWQRIVADQPVKAPAESGGANAELETPEPASGDASANQPPLRIHVFVLSVLALATIGLLAARSVRQAKYWENSTKLFEHAVAVSRGNYAALNYLGLAYEADGEYEDAEYMYREAIRAKPGFAQAHTNLGNVLISLGKPLVALKEYKEAIRLKPVDANARYHAGQMLLSKGYAKDAVTEFALAVQLSPDMPRYYIALADALAKLDREDAVYVYRQAIRLNPRDPVPHFRLANYLFHRDRFDEAIVEYRITAQLNPESAQVRNNLAVALFQSARYAEAWDEVRQCIALGGVVHTDFLRALAAKMPEPRRRE